VTGSRGVLHNGFVGETSRVPGIRRLALVGAALILGLGLSVSVSVSAQAATACATYSGPNFAGRTPTAAQLSKDDLRCANFQGSTLSNLSFEQADLSGADFRRAIVLHSDFSQATLTGADFDGSTLTGTSFEQASMAGVDLSNVHATKASFEQVDLSGISLRDSVLTNADLSQATLRHADLSGADLRGASLDQADLTDADLRGANIAGADLAETTITDAVVTGAVGLPPLDLFAAIISLFVALLALRPRLTSRTGGRAAAWLVLAVLAALTALEAVAASGWQPTIDSLFILPFLTPVIFLAIFVARLVRRPRNGWPTALIGLIALLGFYLLVTAGLAVVAGDLFGIVPFADTCSSLTCGYGVARGGLGIILGIVLIVIAAVLSRLKLLATPPPDLSRWEAMQADGARGSWSPAAVPGNQAPANGRYDPPPPSQSI
jgi:uncharacterized protein YjbI with pentapeptide repeats